MLLLAIAFGCKGADHSQSAAPTGPNGLDLSRVMIIGASMSAGLGGVRIDKLMAKVIKAKHEMAASTSIFFSQSATVTGARQLKQARDFKPTVVIALDFLFWYVYANATHVQRTKRLADALVALARLRGHLVIGDIADMRGADPRMLPTTMVPPVDQLAGFNRQIRVWAANHPNVHVIPFSSWAKPLLNGGRVAVKPGSPAIAAATLLTSDRLHPNADGMRYIVRRLVENLRNAFPDTPKNALGSI